MNPLRKLTEHVARTTYEDLSPQAVRTAKTFILDTLGVAVAGSADPWAARLAQSAGQWGNSEDSTVWMQGIRLPAPSAAIVNAYQIHCLEYDCVHEDAVVHPMAAVAAATLACAERRGGVSGKEFLLSIALGVDVATTIGAASTGAMNFFRPATAGGFGATAAVSRIEGLDEEAILNALGAVYSQICGTMQPHVEASNLLGMQMGFNARAAITAVDLAKNGLIAPHDVLVGQYGYFKLFEGGNYRLDPSFDQLGRIWQITRVSHKPFPTGRLTHGLIDAIWQLQTKHGFTAGEVEKIKAAVPPLVFRLVGRPVVPDLTPNHARFSASFVVAMALLRGRVDVPDFAPARLKDPEIHALAAKVELSQNDQSDETAFTPQSVQVELKDGKTHGMVLSKILGHPDAPLTREQHLDKFWRCWGYGTEPLGRKAGEELIDRIENLEGVSDVGSLTALLQP